MPPILADREDLPRRPAFGHRDQAVRRDAPGDGRGRGGRRLVRGTTPRSTASRSVPPRSPARRPRCTSRAAMANQIALRLQFSGPGHLVMAEPLSHVASTEVMSAAVLSGIAYRTVHGDRRGRITGDQVRAALEPDEPYDVEIVDLVCLENTSGHAGGPSWMSRTSGRSARLPRRPASRSTWTARGSSTRAPLPAWTSPSTRPRSTR